MTKTVGIVGLKGGSGRTTVAVNLAVGLARQGSVLLVDCDLPQGSASSWAAVRGAGDITVVGAATHGDLLRVVERQGFDFLVIDAPPRIAETTRAILLVADLLVIPLGAMALEAWALQDMLDVISEAAEKRPRIRKATRLLWTRYRGFTKSAQAVAEDVENEEPIRALETRLGYRVAYPDAVERGLSVLEWHDHAARQEVEAMVAEVAALLR